MKDRRKITWGVRGNLGLLLPFHQLSLIFLFLFLYCVSVFNYEINSFLTHLFIYLFILLHILPVLNCFWLLCCNMALGTWTNLLSSVFTKRSVVQKYLIVNLRNNIFREWNAGFCFWV